MIAESCRIKSSVVSADEREAGPRHDPELRAHSRTRARGGHQNTASIRHGEAVAYGMLVAAQLAAARGALAELNRQALADLVASLGRCRRLATCRRVRLIEAMAHDKKIVAGRLRFVLPTAIGATTIVDDVTEGEIRSALKRVGFRGSDPGVATAGSRPHGGGAPTALAVDFGLPHSTCR